MQTSDTDKTWFDDKLKSSAWRDLAFRFFIWIGLSMTATYFAMKHGATPIDYAGKVAQSSVPLINAVGTIAMAFAAVACFLKDLEFVLPRYCDQSSKFGKAGGVVRRFAGDLMLWTLGGFTAIFSSVSVAVVFANTTQSGWPRVNRVMFVLGIVLILTAWLTCLVRRRGPTPLVQALRSPVQLVGGYVAGAILFAVLILRVAA